MVVEENNSFYGIIYCVDLVYLNNKKLGKVKSIKITNEGKYKIRAVDKAGNISEKVNKILKIERHVFNLKMKDRVIDNSSILKNIDLFLK